jgi:SAM-dependent methyltransferase
MGEVGQLRPYQRLSRFYDLDWGHFALSYTRLVDSLVSELGLRHAAILDLACGTGILAAELARRGHSITGVDRCAEMIAVARRRTRRSRNRPRFEVRDMVQIDFERSFDLVTCTFDAINYIEESGDLARVLAGVHRSLKPRGCFLFDSTTIHLFEDRPRGTFRRDLGGETFYQSCRYDRESRLATTTFRFADGSREVHTQRAYGVEELVPALERTGFTVSHLWEDFHRNRAVADSHRIFLVGRKS